MSEDYYELAFLEACSILNDLYSDEECSLDHHGYCQTHYWFSDSECPNARARRFLAERLAGAPQARSIPDGQGPLAHDWFFPYDSHPGARECSRCGAHDDSQPCR